MKIVRSGALVGAVDSGHPLRCQRQICFSVVFGAGYFVIIQSHALHMANLTVVKFGTFPKARRERDFLGHPEAREGRVNNPQVKNVLM